MKCKRWFDWAVPRYSRVWLVSVLVLTFVVYYVTRLINVGRVHYDLTIPLDASVPFVPAMIVFYVLAYLFWGLNYILVARENPAHCRRMLTSEIVAKCLCIVCFLAIPTMMTRPEPEGSGLFVWLTRLIYAADTPDNLFPSIHCLDSYLCWRCLFGCKKVGRGYKAFSLCFALAICASTVMVRQHVLVDIPSALLVAEIGLLCGRLLTKKREIRDPHEVEKV